MKIKVNSEIGKLKKVMVHRPGKEVERIYPEIFEALLFDDIMDLVVAREEHDAFTTALKKEGVEVFYIENLVAEAIATNSKKIREEFLDEYFKLAGLKNKEFVKICWDFFMKIKDDKDFVDATIAGIKKDEVAKELKETKSFNSMTMLHDEYPFIINPIPNILFQRDPIASVFGGINIHHMNKPTRQREGIYYRFLMKYHPDWKSTNYREYDDYGSMEGGDILVINKETIFVGLSERTTAPAIQQLAKKIFAEKDTMIKRIVAIEIPKDHATMHLDTVLTQLDHTIFSVDADMAIKKYYVYELKVEQDKIIVNSGEKRNVLDILKKYVSPKAELIVVGGGEAVRARREQWNDGANALTISPGVICVYNRNRVTNELIRKKGIRTIEIPSGELSRGRGGPRCMSMPLEREDL